MGRLSRIQIGGENLVDIAEAKRQLGVSRATIFRMIENGHLISVNVMGTGRTFITQDSVDCAKRPVEKVRVLYSEDLLSKKSAEYLKNYPEKFKEFEDAKKCQDRPWSIPYPRRRPSSPSSEPTDQSRESEE